MKKPYYRPARPMAGFTLLEAVLVIVITGIIGGTIAVFVRPVFDGYFDTVRRATLVDEADVALRAFARDIRLALPNSLRVGNAGGRAYIEFIMTRDGGRYRDEADGSADATPATPADCDASPTPADGPCFLDFSDASKLSFDALGTMPALAAGAGGDFIAVYNLGPGDQPADAYNFDQATDTCRAGGCNITRVGAVSGNTVTMNSNVFATQSPPLPSPSARFQVVPATQQAVTYSCPTGTPGQMTRQWGYGFNTAQATPPAGGSSAALLGNTSCTDRACVRCEVDYTDNVLGRNGLLFVRLTISDSSGESVGVFQQIHVDNSP